MLLVWGAFRLMVTILIRIIVIVRCKGCGIWVMTALWGTLFQLAILPFRWMDAAMEEVGERVGQMMENEVDREPEEEKPRRRPSAWRTSGGSTHGGRAVAARSRSPS